MTQFIEHYQEGENLENENQLFNINNVSSAITAGNVASKNSEKFIKDGDKRLAGKINSELEKDPTMKSVFELFELDSIQGSDIKKIFSIVDTTTNTQFTDFINEVSKTSLTAYIPNWLKNTIPYIGAVAGILEFFSGSSTTQPMNFSVDLNFVGNGALVSKSNLQSNIFYTPGANHIDTNSNLIPIYDNILGVANLMESPELFSAQEAFNIGNGTLTGIKKSYKLSKSIAYAFNPATGLNIEDVSAAIYFSNCEKGIDLEAENFNFEELGLVLPNLIEEPNGTWRTPYLPLSCLEDYSIFIHEGVLETEVGDGAFEELLVGLSCNGPTTLHFVLNLTESFFSATYDVNYSSAPYAYGNTPANPFINIPENAKTDDINKVINNEIQAWNEIVITGGGQITIDNIDDINNLLPKTTNIIYNDNSEYPDRPSSVELVETPLTFDVGSTLPDNFVVTNRPDCGFVPPVDASYLAGFCSDMNKYNPIALLSIEDMDTEDIIKESFQLSPNPTNGIVRLDFELDQEKEITVRVFNMVGQQILTPCVEKRFAQGEYSLQFNIGDFPSGTFIVEFVSDGEKEVRKIVKH